LLSSIGAPEFSSFECQSMTNGVGIDFGSWLMELTNYNDSHNLITGRFISWG
jgi:hypothetical protein